MDSENNDLNWNVDYNSITGLESENNDLTEMVTITV